MLKYVYLNVAMENPTGQPKEIHRYSRRQAVKFQHDRRVRESFVLAEILAQWHRLA